MRWLAVLCAAGCVSTQYTPQVVARGELTLQNHGGLELHAGGRRVARSLSWDGLDRYVGCVTQAREHALSARKNGRAATALSVLGGTFGALALGGFVAFADQQHLLGGWPAARPPASSAPCSPAPRSSSATAPTATPSTA